eukprot:Nk52_evm18s2209 gene=Nk52_evmTU18s2209
MAREKRTTRKKKAPEEAPKPARVLSPEEEQKEIQQMQQEADEVTNESLESTRRMRQMAEESRQMGATTLQKLDEQGEKLNKVENDLDTINADLKDGENTLTEMEKCCGLCVCPWNQRRSFESKQSGYSKTWKGNNDPKSSQPRKSGEMTQAGSGKQQQMIQPITGDAREEEMNENLNVVSDILGDLKNQAEDMNNELESQNEQLDRMNRKAESNVNRTESANKRTTDLLRSA